MTQTECKHENAQGKKFCPDCGKETKSTIEMIADRVVARISDEFDLKRKKKSNDKKTRTIEDELDI